MSDLEDTMALSHDGSGSGSAPTSRPETSTSSNEKEENAAAVLAQKENKNVLRSKALVFLVLLLAAALVGFFTYWFLSESEKAAFESQVSSPVDHKAIIVVLFQAQL